MRNWFRNYFLLLICMLLISLPIVEVVSANVASPATLNIAGKTLRRVDPGFTNAYGGGFVPGPSWGNVYYVQWYHTDYPSPQNPNECWAVWSDTSVRKDSNCVQGDELWVQPVDSDGWAFYDQYTHKYMTAKPNGDVRVSADIRDSWEKFYVYQDVNNPKVYYLRANSTGNWVTTDWTGWVVANRTTPSDWERVWFQRY